MLFLNMEYFYPAEIDRGRDYCVKRKEELGEGEKYMFEEKGWVMLPPECEKEYPYAFGQDHHNFGMSWMKPQ